MEKSSGMDQILTTALKGKNKTIATKLKVCLMLSALMYLLAFVPDFIYCFKMYGFESLLSQTQNLMIFEDVSFSVPIIVHMAILYLIRLLGTMGLTVIILGISSLIRSQIISILLNTAVFGAPAILSLIGFRAFDSFSMVSLLSANGLFFSTVQLVLTLAAIPVISVLGIVLLKRSHKAV